MLHSPVAMGIGAFALFLALAVCVTPAERKVWGWVVMWMLYRHPARPQSLLLGLQCPAGS